jgi:hypothetical protein
LFVLWQLAFLVGRNFLVLFEGIRVHLPADLQSDADRLLPGWREGGTPATTVLDKARHVTLAWSEATAQPQDWALFAPEPCREVAFPALELRWQKPERSVWLLSTNEPVNRTAFLRIGLFRLRRYESNLSPLLTSDSEDTKKRWRDQIEQKLRTDWDTVLAYMKWRWRHFEAEHPGCPLPQEIILHLRRYRIPPPGQTRWDWQVLATLPEARWRQDQKRPQQAVPVERWDPVRGKFCWLCY